VAINVTPIPGLDPTVNDVRMRTAALVDTEILPHEDELFVSRRAGELDADERERARHRSIERREAIKVKVNEAGLWAPTFPRSTAAWASTPGCCALPTVPTRSTRS